MYTSSGTGSIMAGIGAALAMLGGAPIAHGTAGNRHSLHVTRSLAWDGKNCGPGDRQHKRRKRARAAGRAY